MREILFRGKCEYDNEWVEGFYYQAKLYLFDKELCHYITIPYPESDGQPSDHILVHPETVGQFSGWTDKNGRRVFEGDIVEVIHEGVYLCRWDEGNCEFGLINENESLGIAYVSPYDIVVIGNIHDDPELLEVTADG